MPRWYLSDQVEAAITSFEETCSGVVSCCPPLPLTIESWGDHFVLSRNISAARLLLSFFSETLTGRPGLQLTKCCCPGSSPLMCCIIMIEFSNLLRQIPVFLAMQKKNSWDTPVFPSRSCGMRKQEGLAARRKSVL